MESLGRGMGGVIRRLDNGLVYGKFENIFLNNLPASYSGKILNI